MIVKQRKLGQLEMLQKNLSHFIILAQLHLERVERAEHLSIYKKVGFS